MIDNLAASWSRQKFVVASVVMKHYKNLLVADKNITAVRSEVYFSYQDEGAFEFGLLLCVSEFTHDVEECFFFIFGLEELDLVV